MQVISSGGIPLALALAVRGIRLKRPWPLFGAWAVAAWQVSIGFAIGLPFAYLIALLVAIGVVVWWRRGRPAHRAAAAGRRRRRRGALRRGGRRHLAALLPRRRPLPGGDARGLRRRGVLGADRGAVAQLRRELRLGRRDPRHLLRDQQPGREDALPGARDPAARRGRPRLVELPAMAALQPRRRLGRDHGPRLRLPGGGRLAVALPDHLRRAAGMGGDPDAGAARDLRDPGARAARGGRGGVGSAVGGAGSRAATTRGSTRSARAPASSPERSPPSWSSPSSSRAAASRSTRPTSGPSPRSPTRRRRWPTSPARSSTCPPSAARTTAATRCGPPTASPTSSTAAPAPGPTRSRT